MRVLVVFAALLAILAVVACQDDELEERALALGPGGEPCDLEPIDDVSARVVCASGESAVLFTDE